MVRVNYTSRLLADKNFVGWLIDNDKPSFFHLTHIKASSLHHRKTHNIMLEDDIESALKEFDILDSICLN